MRVSRHLDVDQYDDVNVVHLRTSEPMEHQRLTELHTELVGFVRNVGDNTVVLDFGDMEFCPTSIINSVVIAQREIQENGGDLKLAGMGSTVHQTFQILKLVGNVFEVYPTVEAAREALESINMKADSEVPTDPETNINAPSDGDPPATPTRKF